MLAEQGYNQRSAILHPRWAKADMFKNTQEGWGSVSELDRGRGFTHQIWDLKLKQKVHKKPPPRGSPRTLIP